MAFLDNLAWRHAVKLFDETREVKEEDLQKILEAVHFAPSSLGQQPYHITIVKDKTVKEKLYNASMGHQKQIITAPVVLVFSARTDLLGRREGYYEMMKEVSPDYAKRMKTYILLNWFQQLFSFKIKSWSWANTGIALGFALAAAAELQVDSCPMEGFFKGKTRRILNLPHYCKPVFLMPLGYRAPDTHVYPKVRFPKADLFDYK